MRWAPLLSVTSVATLLVACAATKPPAPERASAAPAADPMDAGDDAGDEVALVTGDDVDAGDVAAEDAGPCPKGMVLVATDDLRFCVDAWEASLVETDQAGAEKPYPHWLPVDGHTVRAVSVPDVFPQGYISELQADDACAASGKRLCGYAEWKTACMGPGRTTFPYGDARQTGTCHDAGKSAVGAVFGLRALEPAPAPVVRKKPVPARPGRTVVAAPKTRRPVTPEAKGRAASTTQARATRLPKGVKVPPAHKAPATPARASTRPASVAPSVWAQLNDPRLGQVDGALARTGTHAQCVNGYGALDMVGNLHEWVKTDPAAPHGTFAGGYYLDTSINGDGCNYRTGAHAHDYHDYSTGFRCCAEAK